MDTHQQRMVLEMPSWAHRLGAQACRSRVRVRSHSGKIAQGHSGGRQEEDGQEGMSGNRNGDET